MNEQLHFNEGLYLEPHHLQAMQRWTGALIGGERRLDFAYPYGVMEARLSTSALENHLVRYDKLRIVMPSGLVVQVPENAELPPLNIKHEFDASTDAFTVALGVPLWNAERSNAIEPGGNDDSRAKRLFRVIEREMADENTGENPQPVLVRRINARLLLPDDDRTDLEVVPLLRIAHAAGQDVGLPRLDLSFVPPCLLLSGSTVLRDIVRDLGNELEATRKELVARMSSGFSIETMRGPQFEQMLRLRTLNRFSVRIPFLAESPAVPTVHAYLELRELLAELASLHPEQDIFDVAPYDHDNPALSFMDLKDKIRPHLRPIIPGRFLKVDFVPGDAGVFAALTDEHLTAPNEYFLAIRSAQDPRAVATLAQDKDRFKLMAKSMIRQAVWGVRLQEERTPPLQLPMQTGMMYFRLLRTESARMWEIVQKDKALGARWPQMESSDYQLTLYMTLPEAALSVVRR